MEKKGLAFFGRVAAGSTHEMKNVLAIIKEAAGLMEDLLLMNRELPPPYKERFSRAISGIGDQVRRGVELSNCLNRFAHSVDETNEKSDLGNLVRQVAFLAGRYARLKGVTVRIADSSEAVLLSASPFVLQMALFAGLECCWENLPSGKSIELAYGVHGADVLVSIACPDEDLDREAFTREMSASERWKVLEEIAATLGGTARLEDSGRGLSITLSYC